MLQLKTLHDAHRTRALPTARLHAHSTAPLAARRADGSGVNGTRLSGVTVRAEGALGRARPQRVVLAAAGPPKVQSAAEVGETNVRTTSADGVMSVSGATAPPSEEDPTRNDNDETRSVEPVIAVDEEAPAPLSVPAEDAPLAARPRRLSRTESSDFELIPSAGLASLDALRPLPLPTPTDEDEWELLSLDHDDTGRTASAACALVASIDRLVSASA